MTKPTTLCHLAAEKASEFSYMERPPAMKWTNHINTSWNPFTLGTLISIMLTHLFYFWHKLIFKATLLLDSFICHQTFIMSLLCVKSSKQWNASWCSHYGKLSGSCAQKSKSRLAMRSSNATPGHISGQTIIQKNTCIHVFIDNGYWGFSDGVVVKHLPNNAGHTRGVGSIPESGRPMEQELQYSCLENSMGRGVWWAIVQGVTKSWTQLSTAQKQNIGCWQRPRQGSNLNAPLQMSRWRGCGTQTQRNVTQPEKWINATCIDRDYCTKWS